MDQFLKLDYKYIQLIWQIKMIASQQSYNGSIAQSLAFQDDQNTVQTPTFKVNILSFKHLPRAFSRSFSDFGDMNIDDSVRQQNPQPQNKAYKCYKCFGIKMGSDKNTNNHKCRQCEGSQYIAQSHPLVAIMQQIIQKKIPNLPKRVQQQKKHENKRETLQLQYGCRDAIKEQSFSYQQQMPLPCSSCNKQCDPNNYRTCQKCSDYNICENCFQKKRFSHIHPLILKDISKMPSKMSFMPSNLKKSLDLKQSDSSNLLQESNVKCCGCQQLIDICYEICTDCQKKGKRYLICNKCSQDNLHKHNPYHEFQLRTLSQLSQINHAESNPSIHQNLQLNSISNHMTKNDDKKSISKLNNNWLNSSLEQSQNQSNPFQNYMPQEAHFHLADHLYDDDLFIPKKQPQRTQENIKLFEHQQGSKIQNNSSFMGINMSSSLQLSKNKQQAFIPTIVIPAFHSSPNQLKQTNPEEEYIFNDYQCDICGVQPIKNKKFHCRQCENYDLCQICFLTRLKNHNHKNFEQINGLQLLKQRNSILQVNQNKIHQLSSSIRLKNSYNLKNNK